MVNTTETYWSIDGVSLNTLAWNIETLGPTYAPPPLRGEDILIPYAAGERWVRKVVGSRVMPLGMWVIGSTPDGGVPVGLTAKKVFQDNYRQLMRLLWTPGRQFDLTKRFYVDGEMRSATAKAEFAGGMEPTMIGPAGGKFVVDIKLADPYFYDDNPQQFSLTTGTQHQDILGDATTHDIEITVNGPKTNVEFMNWTNERVMTLGRQLTTGQSVEILVKHWQAWFSSGGSLQDFAPFIQYGGGPSMWWGLEPGDNEIEITTTMLGTIQASVRGAWV